MPEADPYSSNLFTFAADLRNETIMRITSILFMIWASLQLMAQGSHEWQQRTPLPAQGRWGAFSFAIDGYGYVAGGRNGSTNLSDVWRYDPEADSWTQRASMPNGRSFGSSFSINGKGYVACGHLGSSGHSNSLWEYDPEADAWSVKTALPSATRYGTFGFVIGDHGYIGGGNTGNAFGPYVADMWRYDPSNDQWVQMNDLPEPTRYGSTGFAIGDHGYVHSGLETSQIFVDDLWRYDPQSDEWQEIESMPPPGSWMMVMSFGTNAVLAGGADDGVISYGSFLFEPEGSTTWTQVTDYPGESGWGGATFTINGRAFGGLGRVAFPTNSFHTDFWELVHENSTSVEGPATAGVLTIAPNPVEDGVVYLTNVSMEVGMGRITILDASGRVVQEITYTGDRAIVVEPHCAGLYTLVLRDESGVIKYRGKMVVR
jgi:hypothetical protein